MTIGPCSLEICHMPTCKKSHLETDRSGQCTQRSTVALILHVQVHPHHCTSHSTCTVYQSLFWSGGMLDHTVIS